MNGTFGSAEAVTLPAWAKLTLSLRVTGVRADGYHLLESEMVSVDLADTLEIGPGSGLEVVDAVVGGTGIREVPKGDSNLVCRALLVAGRNAHVRLVKRIPPGSGLGGGSSDAAAVLRWAGATDPDLAAGLGADVPFCVRGGRARVSGAGEVVEPLKHEDRRFVLLIPPLAVSTAAVYRQWDRRQRSGPPGGGHPGGSQGNDLEEAALDVEPQLALWRRCLEDATGARARLAGSGSSWFVEGEVAELGLGGRRDLVLGDQRAALVQVRTVEGQLAG